MDSLKNDGTKHLDILASASRPTPAYSYKEIILFLETLEAGSARFPQMLQACDLLICLQEDLIASAQGRLAELQRMRGRLSAL